MRNQATISEQLTDQAEHSNVRARYIVTDDRLTRPAAKPPEWLGQVENQLRAIINLPQGWDSYGAPSPDARLVEAGWVLLLCLARAGGLPKPDVNPTPSGGVQFEWESGARYLELEVIAERAAVYLYRDDAAGVEEAGEVFEQESLEPVVKHIHSVAAVQ
jgi:hypothetical protein